MKQTIIDIKDMTDSKELYGSRPNPFSSAFIYAIVIIILVTITYCSFGKIDIVASASGIVRPNEDVGTVVSLISGKVTEVYYSDGQFVEKGDILLTIDTSESQLILQNLQLSKKDVEDKMANIEKYIKSIVSENNPFINEPESEEYSYYIDFLNYELGLKNTQKKYDLDLKSYEINIESIKNRLKAIDRELVELDLYKDSIQFGENLVYTYSEYNELYQLYELSISELDANYQEEITELENGSSFDNNQLYLEYYQELIDGYTYLVESIENDEDRFPIEYSGICCILWNDYVSNMNKYENNYQTSLNYYNYLLSCQLSEEDKNALLAYDKTMLEGYELYELSIENMADMFCFENESYFYHDLYVDYLDELIQLQAKADTENSKYIDAVNRGDLSQNELEILLGNKTAADKALQDYKYNSLISARNEIKKIKATIVEKEISLNDETISLNINNAEMNVENAKNAISSYRNEVLTECQKLLTEYQLKTQDLIKQTADAEYIEIIKNDINARYNLAKNQKIHQTIAEIENNIKTLNQEKNTQTTNLRLYEATAEMLKGNTDEQGTPVSISLETINKISSLLLENEQLVSQLEDLNSQIKIRELEIQNGIIKAEQTGVISSLATVVKGDTMLSGSTLANIIPPDESEYKVLIYVKNSDIGNIEVGNELKYNIIALPSNQYGFLTGNVKSISYDVLTQNGEYSGYYLVEGNIANVELVDKDGNAGKVTIGMQVEVKIVVQEKTILRYFLEKINLF